MVAGSIPAGRTNKKDLFKGLFYLFATEKAVGRLSLGIEDL